MFKMLHPTFFVVPVAWLALYLLLGLNAASPILLTLGLHPQRSWVILAIQGIVAVLFLTPTWRLVWKVVPQLNRWFYPDLVGEWDVLVESNYSRIDATLQAAEKTGATLDMRHCLPDQLPPLVVRKMRAKITQSWVSMDMELWSPDGSGPIEKSATIIMEPFRRKQGRHGLAYVFEQSNETDVTSDAPCFRGSAWIVRDRVDPNKLSGRMWNDRMWRRGMNTAANITLTRVKRWKSVYQMLSFK
jgi:hypothetical protein